MPPNNIKYPVEVIEGVMKFNNRRKSVTITEVTERTIINNEAELYLKAYEFASRPQGSVPSYVVKGIYTGKIIEPQTKPQ